MPLRSPNGGKFFPPPSPPVDPCAFGLCSGSATATDLAPRACTPTNRRSEAVVTAHATPATNPSLLHWIHASISCRTHQSCSSIFHWFHAFISCRTHPSHHEVLFLVAFVVKRGGHPLAHRARLRGLRPPPVPRLRFFFISSLIMSKILRRDLLPALITRSSSLGPPRFETLSSRVAACYHFIVRVQGGQGGKGSLFGQGYGLFVLTTYFAFLIT